MNIFFNTGINTSYQKYNSKGDCKISFQGGLKNNQRIAEKALNNFVKKYPNLKSNTIIGAKIEQINNKPQFANMVPKLKAIEQEYVLGITKTREDYCEFFSSFDDYLEKLSNAVSKYKHANCKECADLILRELSKKGQKPRNIRMTIMDTETKCPKRNGLHVFTVLGLKNDAVINNPKTWGNKAVIVDGWKKFVLPVNEALDYYKKIFCYDASKHKICYLKKVSSAEEYLEKKKNG